MHRKRFRLLCMACALGISLTLEGCGLTANDPKQAQNENTSPYIPVQDYAGQGYSLPNGEKTGAFVKTHKKEIVDQVNKFFKEKYHLEVTTHNLVGATNAVVAYVESKGEPHFHTSVIVGVDTVNQKVTGNVGAYEGKVEDSIMSGLYAMVYEKEFKNLDRFAESVVKKYPVIGTPQQMINNTVDVGYTTPYFSISTSNISFPEAYKEFMHNHNVSKMELRKLIEKRPFNKENVDVGIIFYMVEKHAIPDKKIAEKIIAQFKGLDEVAPGSYGIFIESNDILKRTGAAKSDTGTTSGKDEIIKKLGK